MHKTLNDGVEEDLRLSVQNFTIHTAELSIMNEKKREISISNHLICTVVYRYGAPPI